MGLFQWGGGGWWEALLRIANSEIRRLLIAKKIRHCVIIPKSVKLSSVKNI
jgi:hypothetical protein